MARTPIDVIVVVFEDDDSDFTAGKAIEGEEEEVAEVGVAVVVEIEVFKRGFV
jgi:hypothetical protein